MLSIKVCKKENKYHRLSFAMLSHSVGDRFAMGTTIELDGRPGVVTGLTDRVVSVLWTDVNEPENLTFARAVNTLAVVKSAAPTKATTATTAKSSVPSAPIRSIVNTGNARVDMIVAKAVAKRMIDATDAEVTSVELLALNEDGLNDYEASVDEFSDADVVDDAGDRFRKIDNDVELTDAEKALARTRAGGGGASTVSMPKLSDLGVGTESRCLSDIKGDKLDLMAYRPDAVELDLTKFGHAPEHRQTVAAHQVSDHAVPGPMDNLRGLTKPIVQQASQFEKPLADQLSEALSDISWGKMRR